MKRPVGRPRQYASLFELLDPDGLYSVRVIVSKAVEAGALDRPEGINEKVARRRAADALRKHAKRKMPEPDGRIDDSPAWYGRAWQESTKRYTCGSAPELNHVSASIRFLQVVSLTNLILLIATMLIFVFS